MSRMSAVAGYCSLIPGFGVAERAHVDLTALTEARGDLGVVTSRGNTGNTLSVQWSLPS